MTDGKKDDNVTFAWQVCRTKDGVKGLHDIVHPRRSDSYRKNGI